MELFIKKNGEEVTKKCSLSKESCEEEVGIVTAA